MDYDKIETEIINKMQEFSISEINLDKTLDKKRTPWTNKIKNLFNNIAIKNVRNDISVKLKVAGSFCPEDDYQDDYRWSEWLYDMAWLYFNNDGMLVDIELVMECEYDPDKNYPDDDLKKLVQARSCHRIFVFHANNKEEVEIIINNCITQTKSFRFSSTGDRYLFIGIIPHAAIPKLHIAL